MSTSPDWLPPLILLSDFNDDLDHYLNVVYDFFRQDFIINKPKFQGRSFRLKRYPMTQGKEATFWHMITKGENKGKRTIDESRCERIRWPKPIIENEQEDVIKVWWNQRKRDRRICLWFEQENYLVVLADRGDYILPWTAYLVEKPHRKRKLMREFEAYWANEGIKN